MSETLRCRSFCSVSIPYRKLHTELIITKLPDCAQSSSKMESLFFNVYFCSKKKNAVLPPFFPIHSRFLLSKKPSLLWRNTKMLLDLELHFVFNLPNVSNSGDFTRKNWWIINQKILSILGDMVELPHSEKVLGSIPDLIPVCSLNALSLSLWVCRPWCHSSFTLWSLGESPAQPPGPRVQEESEENIWINY